MKIHLLIILIFSLFSCQNQNKTKAEKFVSTQRAATDIAVNDILIERAFQRVNYETDFFAANEHLLRRLARTKHKYTDLLADQKDIFYGKEGRPIISIDTAATGYPVKIAVEFGYATSTKPEILTGGSIHLEISGDRNKKGSTCRVTYTNCAIDSIKINGTGKVSFCTSGKSAGETINASKVRITMADGTEINRYGKDIRKWISGIDTPAISADDIIQISGSVNVKYANGISYSRLITRPLTNYVDANNQLKGIVIYSQNERVISELDYGNSIAENLAKLTTGSGIREHWLFDDDSNDRASLTIRNKTVEINLNGNHPQVNLISLQKKYSVLASANKK